MPGTALCNSVGVGSSMPSLLHIAKGAASEKTRGSGKAFSASPLHIAPMDDANKRAGANLKAWRTHRGMSQEDLAARLGTTAAVISLLEAGKRGLSPGWLDRIAAVLDTQPGVLLDQRPETETAEIIDMWSRVPLPQRPIARQVLEAFKGQETG